MSQATPSSSTRCPHWRLFGLFVLYGFADGFLGQLNRLRVNINFKNKIKRHEELGLKNEARDRSVEISKGVLCLAKKERKQQTQAA